MADPTACKTVSSPGREVSTGRKEWHLAPPAGTTTFIPRKILATCAKWKSAYEHSRRDVNGTS